VFNLLKSHWEGANIGINDGVEQVQYDYAKSFARKAFIFGGEIYSGWLTRWYEDWAGKSIDRNEREYGFLMDNNHSYSMYMVHGGSNFGLTAGANAFGGDSDYCGHITSYDYDAPIN
jgi:beta-galactosidase